jgi:cation diffusion facilitator CzcD-associated flavoprotein CzcO
MSGEAGVQFARSEEYERGQAQGRAVADRCDVAVVGAGPYGLSVAAHLSAADGLDVRVFGPTMSFWWQQMPTGMLLRSPWEACHLSDPGRELTLDDYHAQCETPFSSPVPLSSFVEYGRWFQRAAFPEVDERTVREVERVGAGFRLELADGELLSADRVVVAAGIADFAWRPPEYAGLPASHVSHSVDHRDLSPFAGKRVAVVGGGQSALESAALLHEHGAEVEVLVRDPRVHWLIRRWHHQIPVLSRLAYAPPDVGPAFVSWLVALPQIYRLMPRKLQDRLARRSIRAAGSAWLVPRLEDVPITMDSPVAEVARANGHVRLRLGDGATREVDHVLLATGYRVDVAKYPFLSPRLVDAISRVGGYPRLDHGFQTSVPGLHFVGAPAAWSMGPLMRFVAGADFAARSVARAILAAAVRSRG